MSGNLPHSESDMSICSQSESSTGNLLQPFIILGCIVHSVSFGEVEIIEDGAMLVSGQGIIEKVINLKKSPEFRDIVSSYDSVLDFTGKLIIPGFIDAHCHAPQYVFSGTGMDLPLLAWLEKYTFPCEAKFADVDFARIAYEKSIQRHLKCGTTFASYFATIHNDACKILVDVINRVGQRAFVGKVSMDRNSPDFYIEETSTGCSQAEEFARYVLSLTPVGRRFLQSTNIKPSESGMEIGLFGNKRDRKMSMEDSYSVRSASAFTDNETTASTSFADFQQIVRHPRTVSLASTNMEDELDWSRHNGSELDISRHGRTSSETDFARYNRSKRTWSESSCTEEYSLSFANLEQATSMPPPPQAFTSTFKNVSQTRNTLLNQPYTPLVMPCITPRFVPTCTGEMMLRLGEIANRYGLPVQSHMSESVNEIQWVSELHPECPTYAGVYEKFGLLHSRSYMAHCCHSPQEERTVLSRTGASAVHCASSNFMLSSGVMDVRQFLDEGIKVALGTDVAGGYSPSMLDALRQTVIASRVKGFDSRCFKPPSDSSPATATANEVPADQEMVNDNSTVTSNSTDETAANSTSNKVREAYRSLNYLEAFHLATVGGAEVLGMGDVLGNFKAGKSLDCLVVDVHVDGSPIDTFDHESYFEHFQKFLFLGDDRNIKSVFVQGRKVI